MTDLVATECVSRIEASVARYCSHVDALRGLTADLEHLAQQPTKAATRRTSASQVSDCVALQTANLI